MVYDSTPSSIPPSANRYHTGLNYARQSNRQRKVLWTHDLLSVCRYIRICTCTYSLALPQATLSGLPSSPSPFHFPSLLLRPGFFFLFFYFILARQVKQRPVFLIQNRKVRFTGIIPQRVPEQIQLLLANRCTCHFFPVACSIRYRWDRCTKVVSADRVAGFSYPDLCAWFGLSDDSADVVDRFPEHRFGSRDFGVLEVRVAVGANEVGCFNYLF